MGRLGKPFKALVAGVKALKSPSKEKPEKDKSVSNSGKQDHPNQKQANKGRCLWSLGKSSSRNHNTLAAAGPFLDVPEIKSMPFENKQVKDVPLVTSSFTPDASKGVVMAEDASFTGRDFMVLVKREELAAVKIQAAYRHHLASQRISRALRAVVRLQALSRGRRVRKQAAAALRCMQALVKIQALARGRHVRSSELGQLIQKHLQQTRQQRKKPAEGWVSSMATVQQLQEKAQSKQDAVVKRQRALVYAFSEQLNRCTPKQNSFSAMGFQPDKSDWGWVWLERWMAARPWGNPPGVAKEQQNREEMVKIKEDVEVNADSYDGDVLSLKEPIRNSNIKGTTSSEFIYDSHSCSLRSPAAADKKAMAAVVRTKEEHIHDCTDVGRAETEDKCGVEASIISSNSVTKKAVPRFLPSPPPPPPPPPLSAKRAKPAVTHQSSSHESQQAASSAITLSEMAEVPHVTSSARAAELPVETCTSMLATHFKSSCSTQPPSHDLPSSSVMDSIPLTAAPLPVEALTTQRTSQCYPESPIYCIQSTPTTSSSIRESGGVLHAQHDMANASILMPSTSDSVPTSPLQSPSPPAFFSEVQVLPPQKHDIACSPLSIPDVMYDDISNGAYTPEENGITINGGSTILASEQIHGVHEGKVDMNPAECVSVDMKNDLVEVDIGVKEPVSMDYQPGEAVQAGSFPKANSGYDALVVSAREKSTEVSPSKYISTTSKQGLHTEAVSPSVPNYMTTTKSSKAKIRTLTSPVQKLDSPKQKMDSPKPRFDTSKQKMDSPKLKYESPKQKLDSPKQKLDSPKQKLDSPKQKSDSATKRRHSLSAQEGKGCLGQQKSTQHDRASSKGQMASRKGTCSENLPHSNGDSRRHGKPVAE